MKRYTFIELLAVIVTASISIGLIVAIFKIWPLIFRILEKLAA